MESIATKDSLHKENLHKKSCYLITGGAGFFGTILKKYLLDNGGGGVVSIDLQPDYFTHPRFIAYQGDINDTALLQNIFDTYSFDAIFHCAALLAHVKKDLKNLWESNVVGTQQIYDFALQYGIKKIVFISSNCLFAKNFDTPVCEDEIPNPAEVYGKSKLEGERILLSYPDKIHSIIFRSPTIMDEGRLGLLGILFDFMADNKKIPIVGDGTNRYQFIYAKDLANACKLALDAQYSEIFNIGSDDVKSFNDVYEYVIRESGCKSTLLHFPKLPMIFVMKLCFWLKISPLGPYQYKMIASNFVFDTTKIKKKLGFTPTLKNEEMLLKAYNFYRAHKSEILQRKNVSAHNTTAKMGVIKILKWFM